MTSHAPKATVLIRVAVGAVFLSEGIQKLLFPVEAGAGRFAKIGLPSPDILAPCVGSFEILCVTLVLLGLLTRIAAIPLLIVMCGAIYSTKIPIHLKSGFWKMAHEARTDFSMPMGSLFLVIVGARRVVNRPSFGEKTMRRRSKHLEPKFWREHTTIN